MYQIVFYSDKAGNESVKEFILTLKNDTGAKPLLDKILLYIRILEDKGTWIGEPYVKHLVDGIWELRPSPVRILFCKDENGVFVLLHHFRKKTQKTPTKELKIAMARKKDYFKR